MNRTKIQYAVIAFQELEQARRQVDFWQEHLARRLANLDRVEMEEFNKKSDVVNPRDQGARA